MTSGRPPLTLHARPTSRSNPADELPVRRARFVDQARSVALCYRCMDCVHFDAPRNGCSLSYPAGIMLDAATGPFTATGDWIFCKYWELN